MYMQLRAACAGLVFLASTAWAQDGPKLPPVVSALPEAETIPADGVFETVGLRLGMTRADAETLMTELLGKSPADSALTVGISDNRDNHFEFLYRNELHGIATKDDGSKTNLRMVFTTNVNEERAIYLKRSVSYGSEEGSLPQLMEGLTAKYGPPSWSNERGELLHWIWHDGARQVLTEEQMKKWYKEGTPAYCTGPKIRMEPLYQFGRPPYLPSCGTMMVVSIVSGARADLVGAFHIEMFDFVRANRNQADTDAWATSELTRIIEAKGGGSAPEL